MTKVWHISDVHLSFLEDGSIKKRMDQRKWSVGCKAYQGYLDRIQKFAFDNIREEDITCITGDITHDMKQEYVYESLKWLRASIPGTLVICRGNHDKYWDVGQMRIICREFSNFYLIDESEIFSIGSYMFGCYSDHVKKTEDMLESDHRYVNFAQKLVKQAKSRKKTPVMLSHYPVSLKTAHQFDGLAAYLSGHVHCTSADEGDENGVNWKWYNVSAKITDDQTIAGCFFSTATTDVLLAKHGQIFKEIECLRTGSIDKKDVNRYKSKAASAFRCDAKFATPFEKVDPFNTKNTVAGFICRKKGKFQGSLYLTHVNGIQMNPQMIFGTPKLEYPYVDESDNRQYKKFDKHDSFAIADKWNGMNVLFYMYQDSTGARFLTAKSKGTPFLSDTEVGNFLSLTREALTDERVKEIMSHIGGKKGPQSITYELCGSKEPHLVKYDFDIDLKPLFVTYNHGAIKPVNVINHFTNGEDVETICRNYQHGDLVLNQMYRQERGLPHRYEYEHFKVEGKVLYTLDSNGFLIDRTMYKIKPKDIEEVHWQTFDKTMKGRVLEAVKKIKANEEDINENSLQQELDMGPKEWSKFGKLVIGYAQNGIDATQRVVVLVGLPASGKSTVAKIMESKGWVRVNQDELGNRKACKRAMQEALQAGKSVVVDRCNFDKSQRQVWVELAHEHGIGEVECVLLDVKKDVCHKRAVRRKYHPTIKNASDASKAIEGLYKKFVAPDKNEGFVYVKKFDKPMAADKIATEILDV